MAYIDVYMYRDINDIDKVLDIFYNLIKGAIDLAIPTALDADLIQYRGGTRHVKELISRENIG